MVAPEGYTKLGLIGYTDKGTYSASSTYNRYNVVLFEGSSYVALKDNLTGVEPANDGTNWRIFAQGFNIQNAVTTNNFQATLQNYIANNGTTNQAGFAADARQLNPEVEGSLAKQVSELNAKTLRRCIFISDSYGDRENSWIDYAVQFMGLTTGNWYKSALNGAGFKPTYNSYFITLLKNIENNVTNKDTISDIIVGGGFNDRVTAVSDIQTAINEFCTYCKTTYPNAKIWIGAFGWSFNYEFLNELRNGRYIQAYKTCGLYGANYLSGSDFIMHSTSNFEPDGKGEYSLYLDYQYVHPNDRGAQLIAACVMNNLNGAPFHYYEKLDPINIEPNATGGVSFQSAKNVNEIINDNLISYWFDLNLNIRWSTPQTSDGTNFLEIGSIKTGAIAGVSSQNASPMGFMALGFIAGGTTTKNTAIPVYVMIANSKIYVQLSTDGVTFNTLLLLNVRGEINNIFA